MTLFRCKPTPKQRPTMLSTISIQAIDDELEKYQPAKAWDYLMDLNANPVIGVLDAWREHYPSLVEKYRQRIDRFFAFNDRKNCQRVTEKTGSLQLNWRCDVSPCWFDCWASAGRHSV